MPQTDLDDKKNQIHSELTKLPKLQANMLCPTVGFGSALVETPDHTTWLDITLRETRQVDTIVLIPALLKNKDGELETFGFPVRFTIEAWLNEIPGTQHVRLGPESGIYQAIGHYDPEVHPETLTCTLSLNQSYDELGTAPLSVSLFYSTAFECADGLDLQNHPHVTQIGHTRRHQSWAEWATESKQQVPHQVSSQFQLNNVPSGATLFLRIGNQNTHGSALIDDIQLNAPFTVNNGDFEWPEHHKTHQTEDVSGWYQTSEQSSALQRGTDWASSGYKQKTVLVDHSQQDFPNPGIAPVAFSLPHGTRAKKIRIHATRLQRENSWRRNESVHNLTLNEVLIFDGAQNVALNCRTRSADAENFPLMFGSRFAVDGYSYFPPIDPSQVSSPDQESIQGSPTLFFDLGQERILSEIHFYPVDRSPQFSHLYAMAVGFPGKITLRVSNHPDPQTAQTILQARPVHQIGSSPLMRQFHPTSARYVWIEMSKGQHDPRTGDHALGLAEIQLFENGHNILSGIHPLRADAERNKLRHLTDGLTSSGLIMPQKEWILKLHQRAQLELQEQELRILQQQRTEKQHRLLRRLQTLLIAATLAALIVTLIIRNRHRSKLQQLREKIGASLHDEVGANLSSIALSSELLTHSRQLDSPQAQEIVHDITRVAQETATEIRLLSRFLEKKGVESNLIAQLQRIERQMLPGIQTHSDFKEAEPFNALPATDKWELVLFFKEALHNIVKHANASRVEIHTHADAQNLHLQITDNGHGLPENLPHPTHLSKRAKNLNAQLSFHTPRNGGTVLKLTFPKRKRYKK